MNHLPTIFISGFFCCLCQEGWNVKIQSMVYMLGPVVVSANTSGFIPWKYGNSAVAFHHAAWTESSTLLCGTNPQKTNVFLTSWEFKGYFFPHHPPSQEKSPTLIGESFFFNSKDGSLNKLNHETEVAKTFEHGSWKFQVPKKHRFSQKIHGIRCFEMFFGMSALWGVSQNLWVFLKGWWDANIVVDFQTLGVYMFFFYTPTFRESGYSKNVEWTRRYHVSAKK